MAGVDVLNQFPNSFMALAVKLGQSRMVSADTPDIVMGQQENVAITGGSGTALTIPTVAGPDGALLKPIYGVVTAEGGPMYFTIDGTAPSATNYAGTVAQGIAVPFYGIGLLQALKFFGTAMSVAYYR